MIPSSLRAEYLKGLHAGHLGEEKTLLRARETVFWPGISDDVRNAVKSCDVCMKYKPAQQKETLVPHDVPSLPKLNLTYLSIVLTIICWLPTTSANSLLLRN